VPGRETGKPLVLSYSASYDPLLSGGCKSSKVG